VKASNISPITGTANIGAATESNKSATTEIERAVNVLHLKAVGYPFDNFSQDQNRSWLDWLTGRVS